MGLKDIGRLAETGGKALLRGTLVRLLAAPRRRPPPPPATVRRVLAVRQDARLGNLLLLTPSLRLLKTAFPGARLDVLISGRYGGALAGNPCVDEVLTPRSLASLPFRGYDLAVDFSPQHAFSLSSAAWTALSRAPRRVGFDRGDAFRFLDDLVPPPAAQAHETANLALLARRAGAGARLPGEDPPTELALSPEEREAGRRTWSSWGLDGESVALFLGARAEKRLDPAWFLELAARVARSGRKAVLTGGPAESEAMRSLKIPPGVVLAPQAELRPFAAAVASARAVLTADTGPMHLAVALGVPTVELFSHTEPWRFGYGHLPGHAVLHTPGRHPSVDEAWSALSSLLERKRSG